MKKYFFIFPSAIALLFGLYQIYLVNSGNLSPWKLAGFGMFSVIDERMVVMIAVTDRGNKEIVYSPAQAESGREIFTSNYLRNVEFYPSRKHFDELKKVILNGRFIEQGNSLKYVPSDFAIFQTNQGEARVISLDQQKQFIGANIIKSLSIAVWKKDYNQASKRKEYKLVAKEVYAVNP